MILFRYEKKESFYVQPHGQAWENCVKSKQVMYNIIYAWNPKIQDKNQDKISFMYKILKTKPKAGDA